ncbi:MAG: alpha/beta hydrolase [Candidatus Eremiobacteraeota bacterium]|nr:alpha/beta hydrolase [Candidatus Eremiobacteraeota bacterium]
MDDGAATTVETWGERGPLLLAIHGMVSSRKSWERLARRFEGRFRIAAYDQRGHGDSAATAGPMSLDRGVRDAENVAAALGEPIDVLLGHSWGGALAIIAGTHLEVTRVAAIDPMICQVSDSWYEEYLDELGELFALPEAERAARTREEFRKWAPLDVEGKVHAVRAMSVTPIEELWKENPRAAWDLRALIASYPKPLLLALASRGESINDDATLEEVERDHAACVDIVSFPHAGHNLHRTAFEPFVEALDSWLTRASKQV